MSDELSPAHWSEARKLLAINDAQLRKIGLRELRAGVDLLRVVADLCRERQRALHKFCNARAGIGEEE